MIPEALLSDIRAEDFDALIIPGGIGDAGFHEEALSSPAFAQELRLRMRRRVPTPDPAWFHGAQV